MSDGHHNSDEAPPFRKIGKGMNQIAFFPQFEKGLGWGSLNFQSK
jgi:hypothetical protein